MVPMICIMEDVKASVAMSSSLPIKPVGDLDPIKKMYDCILLV